MKTYLNLGCGHRYDRAWTNVDFKAIDNLVIGHNLLEGIPFGNESFDVVYHSHVLEHFSKKDGEYFIEECYRILKPGGIIRIAVPDLERIVSEYLKKLSNALNGEMNANFDYDWIMLELFDQMVRNKPGGNMANYLFQDKIPNEEYVYSRIGGEARELRESYLNRNLKMVTPKANFSKKIIKKLVRSFRNIFKYLFKKEVNAAEKIGNFRLGGEIHQWMYDRYSMKRLLENKGFIQFRICDGQNSSIPNWNKFSFESENGILLKPDSLIIEARKS